MNVEVISKETIKPSKPTPKHLLYHHISLFDHENWQRLSPYIFFYSPINNPSSNIATYDLVNRLKESLYTTLSIFYPLAGRFKDHHRYLLCSDEGVPYVEGYVNRCLFDVVHKAETSELDKLLPSEFKGGIESDLLLALQVNVFECGGIAIGMCINHKISDAFSSYMFLKTWANITQGEAVNGKYLLPYFNAAKIFPLSDSCPSFKLKDDEEVVTKRFVFNAEKLAALKMKYSNDKNVRMSSGLVLSAFIYDRIVACLQHGDITKYDFFQAADLRSLLDPAPPQHFYYGNIFVKAVGMSSTSKNMDLGCDVIGRMKESIIKINKDFIKEIQNGKENLSFMIEHFRRVEKGEISLLGFSNHCSLPVYESDFGWGKPIWVTSGTFAVKNLFIFFPSPSRKQIEAYFCLSKEDMSKLERDEELNTFVMAPLTCKL